MRKNGIDKLEFLVVLAAAALVVVAAVGTVPAYSDDSRTDAAELHSVSANPSSADAETSGPQPDQPAEESRLQARTVDNDGYQWSGSRPADERYVWSHRSN